MLNIGLDAIWNSPAESYMMAVSTLTCIRRLNLAAPVACLSLLIMCQSVVQMFN